MFIEFDDDKKSIVNSFVKIDDKIPEIAISCYSNNIIEHLLEKYNGILLTNATKTPIYKIKYNDDEYIIYTSPVGAPWATIIIEDLIAFGVKKFVIFGSCGVLTDIKEHTILIPEKSRREEGTSYHYIKDLKYIDINIKYKDEFIKLLNEKQYDYQLVNTWTTDAPYRETPNKVKKFVNEGISCVEMEASALSAVAQYRGVDVFMFFYAADSLKNNKWNKRVLGNTTIDKKMEFALLALDFAKRI